MPVDGAGVGASTFRKPLTLYRENENRNKAYWDGEQ